jgi:hypothetical protein
MGITNSQKRTRAASLAHTNGKPLHRKRKNKKVRRRKPRQIVQTRPKRAPRTFYSPSTSVRVLHRGDLETLILACLRLEKQPPSPRGQFSGDRKVWEFFRGLKREEPAVWTIIERIKQTFALGDFSKFSIIDALPFGKTDQEWHEDSQPEGCYNFQISLCDVRKTTQWRKHTFFFDTHHITQFYSFFLDH